MRFGTNLGLGQLYDPSELRDIVQTLDGAGFDSLGTGGHLLTAELGRYADRPPATYSSDFYDPFVLFAYLAAVTERISFRPGILILPLYDTVHVARSAADLARLSGGRFELGVGISWNPDEYAAVGRDFHTRGARLTEQLALLRKLWSEPFVTFDGRFHQIDGLGLGSGLPPAPIPVWIGSGAGDAALRRIAAHADGWLAMGEPSSEVLTQLGGYLEEAGRPRDGVRLAPRLLAGDGGPDAWVAEAQRLAAVGATDLIVAAPPELAGAAALERVIAAKRAVAEVLG